MSDTVNLDALIEAAERCGPQTCVCGEKTGHAGWLWCAIAEAHRIAPVTTAMEGEQN